MARFALLVGASEYQDPTFHQLRSPAHDVRQLARVLAHPAIGDFQVTTLLDPTDSEVRAQVDDVLADRGPDDVVLVYFSCHGVKDRSGRLYFALSNTRYNRLPGTAVPSYYVADRLEQSRAGGRLLLLDCCTSGAFATGTWKSGQVRPLDGEILQNRGYVCITACNAFEYAFEGDDLKLSDPKPSVFTEAVIEGLATGAADIDGDGWIDSNDLYGYVYRTVRGTADQTPSYFAAGVEGRLRIAAAPARLTVPEPPATPPAGPDPAQSLAEDLAGGGPLDLIAQPVSGLVDRFADALRARSERGERIRVLLQDSRELPTVLAGLFAAAPTARIRITGEQPAFGAVVVRAGAPDARMYVSQHTDLGPGLGASMVLEPAHRHWYRLHERQIEYMWHAAQPADDRRPVVEPPADPDPGVAVSQAERIAAALGIDPDDLTGTGAAGRVGRRDVLDEAERRGMAVEPGVRRYVSPEVRALAAALGVDLIRDVSPAITSVVTREDVLAAVPGDPAP